MRKPVVYICAVLLVEFGSMYPLSMCAKKMLIAVLFDTSFAASAEVYEGIAEVSRQQGWELVALHSNQESALRQALSAGRMDGVIAPFMSDRWIEGLPRPRTAMVNISPGSKIHLVPSVVPDDRAVGGLAARHLMASGHRHLASLYQHSDWASCCRHEGFCLAAAEQGVEVMAPPRASSFSPQAGWGSWLQSLELPVGAFAADDFLARKLIEHALEAGLRVPADIAVVGAGNSALDTVLAGIGISSVVLPLREIGRRAALRLVRLHTGHAECITERVLPERVMIRASSACARDQDPLVSRALAVMAMHLADPPTIEALAKQVGASRRTLEMRFRSVLGQSPAHVMRERRMELARQLLKSSRQTLTDIALQCGYADAHHFSAQFRAIHNVPPGQWRKTQT
jgi:LacI family transcriptional regulator